MAHVALASFEGCGKSVLCFPARHPLLTGLISLVSVAVGGVFLALLFIQPGLLPPPASYVLINVSFIISFISITSLAICRRCTHTTNNQFQIHCSDKAEIALVETLKDHLARKIPGVKNVYVYILAPSSAGRVLIFGTDYEAPFSYDLLQESCKQGNSLLIILPTNREIKLDGPQEASTEWTFLRYKIQFIEGSFEDYEALQTGHYPQQLMDQIAD